jgi:hypothetical protein
LQSAFGGGTSDVFIAKLNSKGTALVYATYLGGRSYDSGNAIAVDASGNAYITGKTSSTNFPTVSPFQATLGTGTCQFAVPCWDAFVAKINPTGSALVYSTYLGGSGGSSDDVGLGIRVDGSGNAYVTGWTESNNFPTLNAFQGTHGARSCRDVYCPDVFVTKLNPSGTALVYSTYLGGSMDDRGYGIAVDGTGAAYVTGYTCSTDFPVSNAAQAAGGNCDAFVTKLAPSGAALTYSTYLGGRAYDEGNAIAVDSGGSAYVTGATFSTNFPTVNPLQGAKRGDQDAFVTKLAAVGSTLTYSTYLGGGGFYEEGNAIAVDSEGNAYVTGFTTSTDFLVLDAFQAVYRGGYDVFVTKLSPAGSAALYSTYLGGTSSESAYGIAVDSSGNVYVSGYTQSKDFPTVSPFQTSYGGDYSDAFIAKISSAAASSVPTFQITMSKSTYVDGDTITATEVRIKNPANAPVPMWLRVWLKVPTVGEIALIDIGSDRSFSLPGNIDQNLGPLSLIPVSSSFPPKGSWEFSSRMTNPSTGALLSEDLNPFVVQ